MSQPLRSIAWFKVRPACHLEFEAAFHAAGMLERPKQIEGFLGAELHRSLTAPDEYFVLGEWTTAASYDAWQNVASTGADAAAIERLTAVLADNRRGQLLATPPGP